MLIVIIKPTSQVSADNKRRRDRIGTSADTFFSLLFLGVAKVKIDDGTFFGGEDLVEWLCSRLRQEVAFGAAVRKELEEERLAYGGEFDRSV